MDLWTESDGVWKSIGRSFSELQSSIQAALGRAPDSPHTHGQQQHFHRWVQEGTPEYPAAGCGRARREGAAPCFPLATSDGWSQT